MFYETLKEICQKKNTTPSAVCLAIGISKSNATEWKNGRSPKLDTVVEIANYLNISPSRLIPRSKKKKRRPSMVNDALPRVTVTNQALCFNVEAAKMIKTRHVVVKKVGDLIVFSPTPGSDGFPVNRRKSRGNSCTIYSIDLARYRGLIPGKRYRLFEYKDGCAINIYLALGDDEL